MSSAQVLGMPSFRARTFLSFVVLAVLVLVAAVLAVNTDFIHDDAFISLRYVHNLLHGDGLVWNPGERVEGYTNFLLVILTSALGGMGLDLVLAVRIVNAAAFLGMLAYLARFLAGRTAPRVAHDPDRTALLTAAPLILVATAVPLLVWVMGGLEAPLLAALLTYGVGQTMNHLDGDPAPRALPLAGLAFGLAVLTRPDALIFPIVAAPLLLLPFNRANLRHLALFAAALALVLIPHQVFRLGYYGDALPNTFYAKWGGPLPIRIGQGLGYIRAFAGSAPFLLPLGLVSVLALVKPAGPRRGFVFLWLATLGYALYVVRIGGDYMQAFRMAAPLIPLLALLLHGALLRLLEGRSVQAAYAAVAVALALAFSQLGAVVLFPMDDAAFVGKIVADHIRTHWPRGAVIAENCVGTSAYFAPDNTYIDMLGLVDRHIARRQVGKWQLWRQSIPGHMKGDGAYVLARQPDYIIVGPSEGRLVDDPWFLSDLELQKAPQLLADYAPHRAVIDVSQLPGRENYAATQSGRVTLTYYQRKTPKR